ncbi:MAG: hypothetical protein HKN29_06285 [Rhodothermales bacterium]|nr:hypothetical protein [Rhodothermales bacterium]
MWKLRLGDKATVLAVLVISQVVYLWVLFWRRDVQLIHWAEAVIGGFGFAGVMLLFRSGILPFSYPLAEGAEPSGPRTMTFIRHFSWICLLLVYWSLSISWVGPMPFNWVASGTAGLVVGLVGGLGGLAMAHDLRQPRPTPAPSLAQFQAFVDFPARWMKRTRWFALLYMGMFLAQIAAGSMGPEPPVPIPEQLFWAAASGLGMVGLILIAAPILLHPRRPFTFSERSILGSLGVVAFTSVALGQLILSLTWSWSANPEHFNLAGVRTAMVGGAILAVALLGIGTLTEWWKSRTIPQPKDAG